MIDKFYVEKIIEEVIIENIAEKVLEKLAEYGKRALILFTGASTGFMQSIKSLRALEGAGWNMTAVMSAAAESVLGKPLIKDMLSLKDVVTEESAPDVKSLVGSCNFIVIPSMTVNTASKIANCISDNFITNIISFSMRAGKTIIASTNACCPDSLERFHVTEAYKDRIENNLEALGDYGIYLTSSDNLANKVSSIYLKQYGINNKKDINSCRSERRVIRLKEKIINRNCVLNNKDFVVIKVGSDAIVTDLARDEAAKSNIKIVKE